MCLSKTGVTAKKTKWIVRRVPPSRIMSPISRTTWLELGILPCESGGGFCFWTAMSSNRVRSRFPVYQTTGVRPNKDGRAETAGAGYGQYVWREAPARRGMSEALPRAIQGGRARAFCPVLVRVQGLARRSKTTPTARSPEGRVGQRPSLSTPPPKGQNRAKCALDSSGETA